jgi:argininosuccinate lyase
MFSSSIKLDAYLWREEILQNAAYVHGLSRAKVLSKEEEGKLLKALQQLYFAAASGNPFWSEQDEDIHTAVERALYEMVGEVAYKIHTGRSRNEQIATDLRLYLKRKIVDINETLTSLQNSIFKLASENIDFLMPGYTHLQRAQPVRVAHHFISWFFMLKRDFDRFVSAFKKMDFCPLGSGAIAGNSFGIDRQFVAELLGFKEPTFNSMEAVADRDFVLHFLSQAANLTLHLSRFAEELIIWSTTEFGYVDFDESYTTGSSLMPQKKNPDSLELLRSYSGRVIGAWTQVAVTLKGLPLTYNRDLQEDRQYTIGVAESIPEAINIFRGVIATLKLNTDRLSQALSDEYLLATDLADYLVRKGMPFRKAHEVVGNLIRYCEEKNVKPSQLSLEELEELSPLFEDDYYNLFDPVASVEKKTSIGGTARIQVQIQLEKAESILKRQQEWVEGEKEKLSRVFERLFSG